MIDLGILGGGQLGRMTAIAAAQMGLTTLVFDPDANCCAGQISPLACHAFEDQAALKAFADRVRSITLEFENIPIDSVALLETLKPMHPSAELLGICQDRLQEKDWLVGLGLDVAPCQRIDSADDLASAIQALGGRGILKTRRFGYDGKGQVTLEPDGTTPEHAWQQIGAVPGIVEGFVPFVREVSLIVARNRLGDVCSLPLAENHHESLPGGGKILRTTHAPASVSKATASEASRIGRRIAEASNLTGLIAIEMFLLDDDRLIINELAPRPHNSGHWSIDCASVSQFALLVRAACDLPLPGRVVCDPCRMDNLIGDEATDLVALSAKQGWLHLYGKGEARPGRKMGHRTIRISDFALGK